MNIDPNSAFLMNEVLGILFIAFFQMNRFLFQNTEHHDTFLWMAHTALWAQNQFFWLATNIFDSILMREVYQKSTFVVASIPYVIMPIYLLWTIAHFLFSRGVGYTGSAFLQAFLGWSVYTIFSRSYFHNVLVSLYNYKMILVGRDLEVVL